MTHRRLKPKYLIFVLLFIAIAIFAIAWDLNRLNTDFNKLYTLLRAARSDAFYQETTIIVRFNGKTVTVTDHNKSTTTATATIPSIASVDYDTTLGKDMIVFTWRGTEQYNKRIHGGEIMLKSVLGFRRYIQVNCTGLVKEG